MQNDKQIPQILPYMPSLTKEFVCAKSLKSTQERRQDRARQVHAIVIKSSDPELENTITYFCVVLLTGYLYNQYGLKGHEFYRGKK